MTLEHCNIADTQTTIETAAGGKRPLLRIDETKLQNWVDGQVKNAVQDVFNDILESEAKALAGADKKTIGIINAAIRALERRENGPRDS